MTLIRQLKGFVNADVFRKKQITVHFTSDKYGETISFGHGNTQFTLPYKPIEQMVERERAAKYKDSHFIIDQTDEYIPVDWLTDYRDKLRENMRGVFPANQVVQYVLDDWNEYCERQGKEKKPGGKEKPNN